MMLKYFLLWFPMVVVAIINGAARDLWYKKYMGELAARQISTLSLMIFLGIYIFFAVKRFPPQSVSQSLLVGLIWVTLTLVFEFGLGFYSGNTLSQLLDDYNILKGHIWLLIPMWIISAPYLFFKILQH